MRKLMVGVAVLGLALIANGKDAGVGAGDKAPEFSLESHEGKTVKISDYKDKIVVLEWTNPGCPIVQRHYKAKTMSTLYDKYSEKGVVWLAINSTNDASIDTNKEWVKEQSIKYPVLNDASGKVGHAYGAKTTPHMFVVGKDGTILFDGGIDDDKSGKKDRRTNYVEKALDEILSGKKVSTPHADTYGCSVKFKS